MLTRWGPAFLEFCGRSIWIVPPIRHTSQRPKLARRSVTCIPSAPRWWRCSLIIYSSHSTATPRLGGVGAETAGGNKIAQRSAERIAGNRRTTAVAAADDRTYRLRAATLCPHRGGAAANAARRALPLPPPSQSAAFPNLKNFPSRGGCRKNRSSLPRSEPARARPVALYDLCGGQSPIPSRPK